VLSLKIIKWVGYTLLVVLSLIGLLMLGGRQSEAEFTPILVAAGMICGVLAAFFDALDRIVVLLTGLQHAGKQDSES
jgi:hypothetical protein